MTTEEFLTKKIGFISLGCDKNRVDLEKIIFQFKSNGFKIVNDPKEANIIIINTCSFLQSSRLESINNILEMSKYKTGALEKIIVTGCLNELKYSDLNESLPEVDAFVNVKDNENIISIIADLYGIEFKYRYDNGRILTTPKHYAYLKIADGCNNFCSYCLIPFIRGRFRSTPIEELITEAKKLADLGVKELILVAQDITKYGIDLYGKKSIVRLIEELSKIDNIKWIRLLYCYPEELDDNLIKEIKSNPKVVKYIDIPLQHITNNILKSMNRQSTYEKIVELFNKLKTEIPNIIIRSTFILGFPGETDDDFNQLLNFLKDFKLENVGFFKYSREEGTRSYDFDNQVPEDIKQERLEQAYLCQKQIVDNLHSTYIGQTFDCIIDSASDNYSIGRYYGQCPDIDSVIYIDEKLTIGDIYKIKIISKSDYDLKGERV